MGSRRQWPHASCTSSSLRGGWPSRTALNAASRKVPGELVSMRFVFGRGNADSCSCFCQAKVRSSGRQLLWPASCASSWARASKARRCSRPWNRSSKPSWQTDRPTSRPDRRWVWARHWRTLPWRSLCWIDLFLWQVATSLGLCTLVAEDDILVSWLIFSRPWLGGNLASWCLRLSRFRTCRLRWSASRTCSPAPTPERTGPVPPSPRRRASSTPTHCCPGRCCSPSARPASSKTSCASKTHQLLGSSDSPGEVWETNRIYFFRHLPKLPRLLESDDVNMRIAAGETIALLFELARDMDCVSSKSRVFSLSWLALNASSRASVPPGLPVWWLGRSVWQTERPGHRLQQAQSQDGQEEAALGVQGRSQGRGGRDPGSWRDLIWNWGGCFSQRSPPLSLFIQEGDFQSETIRFGTERMTIDSWVRKRTYDAFREFVGSGMNYHLQVKYLCSVWNQHL